MSEFKPFDDKLAGLIGALSPAGRRKFAAEIAKELRKSPQQSIKQQKTPDGTPSASRSGKSRAVLSALCFRNCARLAT